MTCRRDGGRFIAPISETWIPSAGGTSRSSAMTRADPDREEVNGTRQM
jgi:hypothetical protein